MPSSVLSSSLESTYVKMREGGGDKGRCTGEREEKKRRERVGREREIHINTRAHHNGIITHPSSSIAGIAIPHVNTHRMAAARSGCGQMIQLTPCTSLSLSVCQTLSRHQTLASPLSLSLHSLSLSLTHVRATSDQQHHRLPSHPYFPKPSCCNKRSVFLQRRSYVVVS